jgi:hypothetical protein
MLGELLLSQRTLLQTLYFSDGGATLSVLWSCYERGSGINVHLLATAEAFTEGSLHLVDLLPSEYGWEAVAPESITKSAENSGLKFSARVTRRLAFANLPHIRAFAAREAPATPTPGERPPSTSQGWSRSKYNKRRLPDRSNLVFFATDVGLTEWCIPILAEVADLYPNRRRLCEELQRRAPAVVSLTCHPVSEQLIDHDREQAVIYRQCLEELGVGLANAGFASVEDLYRVYHRYLLGKVGLCHITLSVAAASQEHSVAIAQSLCARSGGMKTFTVSRPSEGGLVSALWESLLGADRKVPVGSEEELQKLLKDEGIEPPDQANREFLSRLPHLYTLDEAETLLRLPFGSEEGLPGLETHLLPPFYSSTVRPLMVKESSGFVEPPKNEVRIGRVEISPLGGSGSDRDAEARWHTIKKSDLCKHALLVGSTGSGKTVTTTFLVRELLRLNIDFLVIEPVKTEYADQLRKVCPSLRRWRFEAAKSKSPFLEQEFLAFDPMRLQDGVTVARHVSYLKSCFEAAFPLEPWMALFLENGLMTYYTGSPEKGGCGLDLFSKGGPATHRVGDFKFEGRKGKAIYPSFDTFRDFFLYAFLEQELPKGSGSANDWAEQNRQIFRRRFKNLSQGPLGCAFTRADEVMRLAGQEAIAFRDPIGGQKLFNSPTVVELDAITDTEQKALIMAFLLTFLFEKRQVEDAAERKRGVVSSDPKHVLIIEEAHRLLANSSATSSRGDRTAGQDAKAKAVGLFVDMLAEIRAWRQGIFIVEQIPTKIVPEAVKNTNLKIMLRTTAAEDRDYLGSAMNFNDEQKLFVSGLRAEETAGIQYVAFEEGVDQPVLLTLPHPKDRLEGEVNPFDRYFQKPGRCTNE